MFHLGTLSVTFYSLAVISRTNSFNTQKFYMVLTLSLIALYGLLPCTTLMDWFCVAEVESVYCAVRTESLYNTDIFRLYRVNMLLELATVLCATLNNVSIM
jgi:hypothetical protein